MDDYLRKIRDLEKSIDKRVESLELTGTLDESIESSLSTLFDSIEKAKNLSTTPHEEKYLKQYSANAQKLKSRFSVSRSLAEDKVSKSSLIGNQDSLDSCAIDILLKEGQSLDNSLNITSSILQSAQDVKLSLAYQKQKVLKSSERIVQFIELVPGINGLLGKISRRKRVNALVIGIALFICMIITFFLAF